MGMKEGIEGGRGRGGGAKGKGGRKSKPFTRIRIMSPLVQDCHISERGKSGTKLLNKK